MSAPRRYAASLLVILACALLVSFAVNTTVNPWRVTPTPWSAARLDPYRDISSQIRTGKAGIVRATPDIGVGIVGSSRVANGLDPESPAWGRQDVVNLGCSGGFFYEAEALCRYLLDHHSPELVLFGIDPGDLSSDTDTRRMGDFHASPLDPAGDPLNRELRYLFGVSTLEASFQTLARMAGDEPTQYTPKGLRARPKIKARGQQSQLYFIRSRIVGEAEFDLPDDSRAGQPPHPVKMERFEALLREGRRRGTRLIVFFHPQHALLHARAADAADPPVLFENERRAVAAAVARVNAAERPGPAVEAWDFYDHHPLNCDPLPRDDASRMEHWDDLGHYTIEMGNLLLARMLGWPPPAGLPGAADYGARLEQETLGAHLARLREGYRRYLTGTGAADVALKEQWIAEGAAGR
jgi:hypothetical protein